MANTIEKIIELNQPNRISSDNALGIFTYCLTKTPVSFPSVLIGIDGVHEVYCIEQEGLFSVVSNIFLEEFNENTLDKKMTDVTWLAVMGKRFEDIIDFVMIHTPTSCNEIPPPLLILCQKNERNRVNNSGKKSFFFEEHYTPVVPLRFCTIYKNQEGLFNTIKPYKEKIMNFLDYAADKAEWSVKIFCDKFIFMDNNNKNKCQSAMPDQTSLLPGEAYLLTKKRQKIREETFKADIQTIVRDIYGLLSKYSKRSQVLRCTDKAIHGRSLDMVMNTTFLVEWQTFSMFRDLVNILSENHKDKGLTFDFSGPWPPYNFCPELNT